MLPSLQEDILNDKNIDMLNRFERDVAVYDKLSELSAAMSSVGILCSIFIPILLYHLFVHGNPFSGITIFPYLYCVIGGILMTVLITRLAIIYADHKKHQVSRTKYRPITGFCMCDLSIFRSHARKLERAKTMGDRLRYVKLMNYYSENILRQRYRMEKLGITQ